MDYTIKQGDNLTNIAKANNTTIADIAKLNNIQNPNLIKAGTTLKLSAPTTPIATTNPATSNVNADILSNVQKVQLPQAPAQSTLTVPLSLADKAIQDTQVQLTDSQKTQDNLISKQMEAILGMNSMGTEAGVKQDELNKLGYQQKLQDYNTLNSQILTKQAELNQSDIQLISNMRAEEKRDTLLPFAQMGQAKLQGDAAIMRALKTSEIGVLNAQVLAKQGDIQMAQQVAQDAVDAKFAPYKQQIQTYTDLLKAIDPILTRDEKKQANEQKIRTEIALKEIDKVSDFQKQIMSNAISSNAPQSVINAISRGQTIEDITKAGAGYLQSAADKLELQLKRQSLANLGLTGQKIQQELNSSGYSNLTPESAKVVASVDPVGYFSSVIKENKIKGSASLESLLGVIGAAKDLADYGIEKGKFKGAAPIRLTPGVFKGEQQITTQGNINAINLKVQQWASGASLTDTQTKQVKRFTPDKNDTDKQIRTKLNNLTNFMMEQGRSSLATQGVNIDIPKINLFDTPKVDVTEDAYAEQLLSNPANSPFNIFEQ